LKKKVEKHEEKLATFQSENSGSLRPQIITKGLYDEDLYQEHKLDKGKGESSVMGNTSSNGKKGKGPSDLWEKFFDQLETAYITHSDNKV
jgi:hypothetical protein